jgi:hypothetical protein
LLALNATPPLLVSASVLGALMWPTLIVPKLKDASETVAVVNLLPVRLTTCGLLKALSVNVSVPLIVPVATFPSTEKILTIGRHPTSSRHLQRKRKDRAQRSSSPAATVVAGQQARCSAPRSEGARSPDT